MKRASGQRGYLAALREAGELVEVTREVDPHLEMAAMARLCGETGAPTPLFTRVAGADPTFRAVGALVGVSARRGLELGRIALALGLAQEATAAEIMNHLCAARAELLRPTVVDAAPCQENVLLGDEIDLLRLPLPQIHANDGGRYLNTLGVLIVSTPDGRWTNWSVTRLMARDARSCVVSLVPVQHLGRIIRAWRDIGRDMPFALALGPDPTSVYAACAPLPSGLDEVEFAGALRGEPVELVPCRTVALQVPAESEIVIEGHLSLLETAPEGPYAEWTGYVYPAHAVPQPVLHVDALTHRDDPVYPFVASGEPPDENHTIWGVAEAAEALHELRAAGLPVTTAWSPFSSCNGWLAVTVPPHWAQSGTSAVDFCRCAAEVLWSIKAGNIVNTLIVLEDDINPADPDELIWAIDSRWDRGPDGHLRLDGRLGWPMSPYIDPEHFNYHDGWMSSRAVLNCLPSPTARTPIRSSFAIDYPAAVQERVLDRWEEDGFGPVGPIRRRGRGGFPAEVGAARANEDRA